MTSDGGRHWTTRADSPDLPQDGLRLDKVDEAADIDEPLQKPVLGVLSDGRVFLSTTERSWLADDRSNRTFHKVKHPARFTSVTVQGDVLLGIADADIKDSRPDYELVENEGLWISKDGGRKWSRFPSGD